MLFWGFFFFLLCWMPFIKLPIFLADYWFSKWVVVYAATLVFAISFCLYNAVIYLPRVTYPVAVGLSLLTILIIFNHWYHSLPFLSPAFWDRLCFILLSISFFNVFKKDPLAIQKVLSVIFIANALFLVVCLPSFFEYINGGSRDLKLLHQNFGNINISAEFVGISLVLIVSGRSHFPRWRWLIDTLACLSAIYCYYASSRSIAIAVIFSLGIFIFFKKLSLKKILKLIFITSLLIIFMDAWHSYVSGGNVLILKDSPSTSVNYIKPESTICRWQIIKATCLMILDHPFGVGPGNYLFSFIPYMHHTLPGLNENNLAQSPHNEYLRIIAEDGIPFAIILFLTILIYLYSKRDAFKSIIENHPTLLGFFCFLVVQAAFQFPLINGFPFLMTTCFVGYALFVFHGDQVIEFGRGKWWALTFIVGVMVISGILSEVISFRYFYSASMNQVAYALNGSNSQASIQAAKADMAVGKFISARQILEQELKIHPSNFIALSVKAHLEVITGNKQESCKILKQIDAFFAGTSIHHSYILHNCSISFENN